MFETERKRLCLNMISSRGSGKTTILGRTINELGGKMKIGVIEGNIQADIDAERISGPKRPLFKSTPKAHGICRRFRSAKR